MQLVGVLLLAGLIRTGWARRAGGSGTLPGSPVSIAVLADSARSLAEAEARRSRPLGAGERLDPNRAPEEELDRLPGVGPSTARAIVQARDTLPFTSVDDLVRVRGIGSATLRRLASHLAVATGASARRTPVGPGPRTQRTGRTAPRETRDAPVDVNRASAEELQRLPRVGPVLADRIVEFRRERGPFRLAEDLLAVPGIGPATLERLRPLIRF